MRKPRLGYGDRFRTWHVYEWDNNYKLHVGTHITMLEYGELSMFKLALDMNK